MYLWNSLQYEGIEGKAEHLVYLDKKGTELEKLIIGTKQSIIRGAAGRKSPLGGRVKSGDVLYFVETGGSLLVTHKAVVKTVLETNKMTEDESKEFVDAHASQLNLAKHQYERWVGKKFLCVITIDHIEIIEPFEYNREKNMDDWIITDDINKIKKVVFVNI
ncbi:hypothetical protein [Haploplasma axanthum]|uniref:ASCH domain-containing protein n=1 Tax=Haploplasma axanthum TaxID=29552 RepID=A0A449BFP8_HAPAX|nr:hypothetical protein [Haploplasma axanthum]VEU81272.1 Uncharacterised protein [Haploplasma axanthum]